MANSSVESFLNMSHLRTNASSFDAKSTTEGGKIAPRPWDFGEITLLILLIFGTFGNMLTILVMRTKRMRNSNAAMFIISMAISDIILLVLKFTANMIKIYRIPIYNFCIAIQVIPQAASFISVWLIVITSAERTCAVMMPLKVAYLFSKRHSKILMLLMFTFFIALSATVSVCIHYSKTQPYYCVIRGSMDGSCFVYYTYIFPWLKSAFGSWIPSLIGIVLNVVIIAELFRASNARRGITNNQYADRRQSEVVGTMLLAATAGNRARHLSAGTVIEKQSLVTKCGKSSSLKKRDPRGALTLDLNNDAQLKRMSFEFDESRATGSSSGTERPPVSKLEGLAIGARRKSAGLVIRNVSNMPLVCDGGTDGGNTSPHHLSGHAITSQQSTHGHHSGSHNSKEKQITIM
jgi:hypothetical protein